MSAPILKLPQPDRPYTLHTDYCALAISGVLEQSHADGKEHVVAYASKGCSPAEASLISTEGELLALVWAINKFHQYLTGARFTVVTDYNALQYLESAKGGNHKLTRWAVRLANYDFQVKY